MTQSNITLEQLTEHLIANELVAPDAREVVFAAGAEYHARSEAPLLLRIFMVFAALIATFLLGAFFAGTGLFHYNDSVAHLFGGLAAGGLALLMYHRNKIRNPASAWHSFIASLSFCFMLIAKCFLLTSFVIAVGDSSLGLKLLAACITLTLVGWFIYPVSLDRFISVFATLGLFSGLLVLDNLFGPYSTIAARVWFAVHIVAIAIIFTSRRIADEYRIVGYALIYSLFVLLPGMALVLNGINSWDMEGGIKLWQRWDIQAVLGLAVLYVIGWANNDWRQLLRMPQITAVLVVALLAALGTGILLALMLLMLGYGRRERGLLIPGLVLLPLFLIQYYYFMDVTLMQKSSILIGSGAVLLAAWLWLRRFGFDGEGVE
jgi:hypothetical protein